jgi:hypothetical protein
MVDAFPGDLRFQASFSYLGIVAAYVLNPKAFATLR